MNFETKADFDDAYSFRVERYLGRSPAGSVPGIDRAEIKINYHEYSMRPIMVARWRAILPALSPSITASDRVIIVGAGFGWGVRALRQRIGCACVGTDISPYIQAVKNTDDESEISDKITAGGLDPASGRGLQILNAVKTPGARAQELVLDEDLATGQSRARVMVALGGNPTFICWEDLVSDAMSDQDVQDLVGAMSQSSARKFFIYTPTANRSAQELATLSGHRVITINGRSVGL